MKSLCETLATGAALATGAVLLTVTGCGGAPSSAPDVPAVTEAKPSGGAATSAAPVTTAKPGTSP